MWWSCLHLFWTISTCTGNSTKQQRNIHVDDRTWPSLFSNKCKQFHNALDEQHRQIMTYIDGRLETLKPWLWETINFHRRKTKVCVRTLKISLRSSVINESSLCKLRGLLKYCMVHEQRCWTALSKPIAETKDCLWRGWRAWYQGEVGQDAPGLKSATSDLHTISINFHCCFLLDTINQQLICQYHLSSASICTNSLIAYKIKLFVVVWNNVSSTSICTNSWTVYVVKLFVFVWNNVSSTSICTNSFTTYTVKLFVFVLNNVNVIIQYYLATPYHMCIFISHSNWLYVDKHTRDLDKSLLSSYMSNMAQTLHQPLFEHF